jgi:hypothetical protein
MVELNTGSIIHGDAGENKTFTGVSTNIIIKVGDTAVGAIRSLSVNEARKISMIDEVGTDGHIDSVPSASTNITGSCQRTRFNNLRMAAAFGRSFIHLHSQRIPFDIDIIDTFAGQDPGSQIVTTIKNVWMSKLAITYRNDDFVLVEDMEWEAEAIYSVLGANGNAVPGVFGGRNVEVIDLNEFERAADRGDRRGALDAAGLLNEISTV